MMQRTIVVTGTCLGDDGWLEIEEVAQASGAGVDFIRTLVDEGLLRPAVTSPAWRFGGEELARIRRIRRLQRDFAANLQSVAVMLDLMDQVERLQAELRRAGLDR